MCVCVCVYVCVCGSSPAQTDGSIFMKFSTNDMTDICEVAGPLDEILSARA